MATPTPASESPSREGTINVSRIPQNRGASGGDLRRYYADFPWNDYCFYIIDQFLCAEHITEVIVSGMEM
ncbi:hypothetical protein E2C01_062281 [Portunus trituberculatus]|uniref:Uncharacterized protein n=1 Tax=Portunus trituberculatus TaxID=210409 RepID=A0A5B7HE54_PORTR|nr:hypothetical protein [Portunus trituberculatus]